MKNSPKLLYEDNKFLKNTNLSSKENKTIGIKQAKHTDSQYKYTQLFL